MKTKRNRMNNHWKPRKLKKHERTIKKTKGKPKESLKHKWKPTKKNMKTTEKRQQNQRKPKKTTMTSKEQLMKIIENQRKIYEKPKKEQQWKTKDNFASILFFFAGTFCHCFFEFFICNGERNKRWFWKKRETCLEVSCN